MYWQGCWLCLYLFMRGDLVNRERIKKFVGGQAVIEGVMMRGPGYTATAVREPAGTIVVQKEATSILCNSSFANSWAVLNSSFESTISTKLSVPMSMPANV